MSIFRRVSLLGFALASLVVLAACGGDGDGDGAFELPPPGEYSFEVTGTMEIEFSEAGVSAAPLILGQPQTVDYQGSLRISLGENGKFTIKDREGAHLVVGNLEGGPVTLYGNEVKPSTGTISNVGMKIELNVIAELRDGVTTTHDQPFLLEGDGDPFSEEGATLTPPADAEPVRFMPVPGYDHVEMAIGDMFIRELLGLEEFEGTDGQGQDDDAELPTAEPPTDTEPQIAINDASGDAYKCADGEDAVVVDLAVDMLFGSVTQLPDGVVVRVSLAVRPIESAKDASFAVQAQIGQEGRSQVAQYEFSGGQPNNGRLDDAGNVIPGSEGDVTATGVELTFTFSDTVLKKGDTVTVRSSHQRNPEDAVNCDVTDAFLLDELVP